MIMKGVFMILSDKYFIMYQDTKIWETKPNLILLKPRYFHCTILVLVTVS